MDKKKIITEAIVLAGGLGTRLRPAIGEYPKPLAPINGRPFLAYLLDFLVENKVEHIVLAVGYKWELIQAEFGTRYKGIQISYSVEKEQMGTGGAIKLALNKIQNSSFFVLNGDTFFNIPLQAMARFHQTNKGCCSIALLAVDKNERYGQVIVNEAQKIIEFREKEKSSAGLINGGIYTLDKDCLADFPTNKPFSFERDFLAVNTTSKTLFGVPFQAYFKDIGIPEDYGQFEKDVLDDKI